MRSVFFAAALLAFATPAIADVVVFSDSAMNPADYRTTIYADPAVTTQVGVAVGYGPVGASLFSAYSGSYLQFQNPNTPRFQFLNEGFVYDPSALGAIDAIQASLFQNVFMSFGGQTVNVSSVPVQLRLLAEQDGTLYEAVFRPGGPYLSGQWQQSSRNGIVASDFRLFDPAAPWAPHTLTGLDFAGSAITFGFAIAHFALTPGSGADSVPSNSYIRADNFELVIYTQDPSAGPGAVPEPATWAMMILGFGAVGSVIRRRQPAPAA